MHVLRTIHAQRGLSPAAALDGLSEYAIIQALRSKPTRQATIGGLPSWRQVICYGKNTPLIAGAYALTIVLAMLMFLYNQGAETSTSRLLGSMRTRVNRTTCRTGIQSTWSSFGAGAM